MTRLGIDIGGTSVKAAVWRNGAFVRTGQSPFYAKPTTGDLRSAIAAAVGDIGDVQSIEAAGLCVPGMISEDRTQVMLSVNVPGLMGIPLNELVPRALGSKVAWPTTIANDAAATATDLLRTRGLKGRTLVLTLGTGVGCAVSDDGVLLNVVNGTPGEFGQIDVSIAGHDAIGPDGGRGGLEGYLGVAALRDRYGPDVTAAVEAFTGEEPPILALVRAIRIAHAIYRPHHICLCGGIGTRLKRLLPTIQSKVNDHLTSVARADCTISCGDDDFHAARGAAQLARREN